LDGDEVPLAPLAPLFGEVWEGDVPVWALLTLLPEVGEFERGGVWG